MSIGVMDDDILNYSYIPFNLDIMKLSSYYKKRGEIVTLAPKFTPRRHSKFIYRKDYDDGKIPFGLGAEINVEYGGHAFTGARYVPLAEEIEICKPDTYIYSKIKNKVLTQKDHLNKKTYFENMSKAEHCRLSLDGKTIWKDYEKQFQNLSDAYWVFFHDYDLNKIENAFDEVKRIVANARNRKNSKTRICTKFPIQVNNGQDLLNWTSLYCPEVFYTISYDGIIDDEVLLEWINLKKQKNLYARLEYHVTSEQYDSDDFVKNLLPKIFRQIIISRMHRVYFPLKYDKGYFSDERWEKVLDMFNQYHQSCSYGLQAQYFKTIGEDTLFDYAKSISEIPSAAILGKVLTKQEIREAFAFVRENNYPLFVDFYECNANKLIGGKI